MKQRSELATPTKILKYVLIGLIVFLGLICLYYGSSIAPGLPRNDDASALDDGVDPVIRVSVSKHVYFDELFEDQEHNPEVPKSIPVCVLFEVFVMIVVLIVVSKMLPEFLPGKLQKNEMCGVDSNLMELMNAVHRYNFWGM